MKTLLAVLAVLCVTSASRQLFQGHKVFRVVPKTVEKLQWLQSLPDAGMKVDVWNEPKKVGQPVDVQVAPEHVNTLQTALDDLHMEYTVVIQDLQQLIDSQDKQHKALREKYNNENFVEWNYDRYLNLSEAHQWLEEQAAACGSARCSLFDIGLSFEGRRLPVIKISGAGGQAKPTSLWIDAGIHAREWISPAVAEYFIERFIHDYGIDEEVTTILNRYDVYILAIMNPDGYEWTWTDNRMWRKSRQPWRLCTGTDINRNFDFHWMEIGASDDPCSETYAGPFPYSEPEALAVSDFVNTTSGIQWDFFLTLHSYSQLWMLPYGYTTQPIPTYDELRRVADIGAAALFAVNGTVYQTGAASEILYASSGTSRDWAYGVPQIPYVYTIELRDTGEYGFILPPELIWPTVTETWAGYKAAVVSIP